VAVEYILWLFGIFSPFLVCCNLATLLRTGERQYRTFAGPLITLILDFLVRQFRLAPFSFPDFSRGIFFWGETENFFQGKNGEADHFDFLSLKR
jgi:hypothetical protein